MGNRDKKQAQQDIGAEKTRLNTGYNQFESGLANAPATKTAGEFASTGGVSPLDTEATQGYRNFASTGGVTPDFASNLRARASRVPAATFSALSDRLRRAGASSYAPGLSTAQARLARGSAQAGAESSIGAESQLQDMIRSGKLQGIGGLESQGQNIAQRRLQGVGGLQQADMMKLQAMGMNANDISRLLGQQIGVSQLPGTFDRILQIGGIAAGGLTGLGGLGRRGPRMSSSGMGVG